MSLHVSQGVKEVTLLGQNVNSYRDTSEEQFCGTDLTQLSRGFKTIYKAKQGGLRFSDLLDRVSRIDPDMRIRFTSPHPKDFPDEVHETLRMLLFLLRERTGFYEFLKALNRLNPNPVLFPREPAFLLFGLKTPDLVCVFVFTGFAPDCGANKPL